MPDSKLTSDLSFQKPLIPTNNSRLRPPHTDCKDLRDFYLIPIFPSAGRLPEPEIQIHKGMAFFEATQHCIGATTTVCPTRLDNNKLQMIRKRSDNPRVIKLIDHLAIRRMARLRFRRAKHEDPIFQRVAGIISADGSAKLLVARYHDQCLNPDQFKLLCNKILFGESCDLGRDFPKSIQYRIFDLDNTQVRKNLRQYLFPDSHDAIRFKEKFKPIFLDKAKRAELVSAPISDPITYHREVRERELLYRYAGDKYEK